MTTREQLNAAGLETETCPMQDCYGHLAFIHEEQLFRCSMCGQVYPTSNTGKTHKQVNRLMKSFVNQWVEESRIEAELLGSEWDGPEYEPDPEEALSWEL